MSEQNQEGLRSIRRALLSVSDKTGLVEFARALGRFDVELLSTGGTARALREAGIEVRDVSEVTGFPEMLDGRVKTLHPRIHGGLLAVRENAEHMNALSEHNIEPIDMVVINLYPFEQTIERAGVTLAEAVEQIDIGGPAMVRSAAKNYTDVAVVTAPELYERILGEMREQNGALSLATRGQLARLAFMRTAFYDSKVFSYLGTLAETGESEDWAIYPPIESIVDTVETYADVLAGAFEAAGGNAGEDADDDADSEFDEYAELSLNKLSDLRYGENPHQAAALYEIEQEDAGGVAHAELLSGKEMSFNNYVDADAAWQLACEFQTPACAIIKHTNPAGVALGASPAEAYRRALATDPVSAFGGIVAFNHRVDDEAARAVTEIFTEVVIAPAYDEAALTTLRAKKNLRVLRVAAPGVEEEAAAILNYDYKKISGGMLVQTRDLQRPTRDDLKIVSRRAPTAEEIDALLFAWSVCKHTKSNAIVYARAGQTIGVGAGQMSRVDSVRLGAMRAQLPVAGAVLASDAFFPFRDGIDEAANHNIAAVIQPGGSVRDEEVIAAADEHDLAMVFTGIRHFKH
ncbi:MAG TPA: bifunctional phosphoribosylaminoimidazolecarboxamide formyltransferase/IMP cyclohydrolase [Pyrinomonadaceae bacterium]|jgi:phosphoribosylaminoimidazolecarboxamide formyltransferase/IMP cyclohydrolase|nr:bifunctional phosphoribosylaminoimidazolecarboxamide formyltransferase/IMP cyclohydrolase [Pyrinomonadaceae bacterium]